MREIKFRGWNTTDKTMGDSFTLQTAIGSRLHNGLDTSEVAYMQYTGLKDKNGKEIYEEDILSTTEGKQTVKFALGGFVLKHKSNAFAFIVDGERYEIIGNIYENPELLTK